MRRKIQISQKSQGKLSHYLRSLGVLSHGLAILDSCSKTNMNRREVISSMGLTAAGAAMVGCNQPSSNLGPKKALGSVINHSVCRWCYNDIPLEEFADKCKDIGISSIELLRPDEWEVVKSRGLEVAIGYGTQLGLTQGFCNPKFHAQLKEEIKTTMPLAAEQGIPQIITFSGNREGIDDEVGMDNCARGLEEIVRLAETYEIMIVMELLNSKIDHKDYMCDYTDWGRRLVEKVGSPNFKLLYDIYHMQIMEGDVIRTITESKDYIGHYHTGGVPGRNEIDETQELYYPAIMKAIAETGFEGFVAQEFIPSRDDDMTSLKQGIEICDITI